MELTLVIEYQTNNTPAESQVEMSSEGIVNCLVVACDAEPTDRRNTTSGLQQGCRVSKSLVRNISRNIVIASSCNSSVPVLTST